MQRPLATAAIIIALACIAGCTQRSALSGASTVAAASARATASNADNIPQPQPIRFLIILDKSGSVKEAERKQICQILLPAIRSAIARGNVQAVILTFDSDARELGIPEFHKISEFVNLMESNYIHEPGATGTNFAPVALRIQDEARRAEQAHQRLIVFWATDGGFSQLPAVARLAGQLQRIQCLDLLAMGPLTYELAPNGRSYYDNVKQDLVLAGFDEIRLLAFPNQTKMATDAARELQRRIAHE